MRISDWSSDVCSSDLVELAEKGRRLGIRKPVDLVPVLVARRQAKDRAAQCDLAAAPDAFLEIIAADQQFALAELARQLHLLADLMRPFEEGEDRKRNGRLVEIEKGFIVRMAIGRVYPQGTGAQVQDGRQ